MPRHFPQPAQPPPSCPAAAASPAAEVVAPSAGSGSGSCPRGPPLHAGPTAPRTRRAGGIDPGARGGERPGSSCWFHRPRRRSPTARAPPHPRVGAPTPRASSRLKATVASSFPPPRSRPSRSHPRPPDAREPAPVGRYGASFLAPGHAAPLARPAPPPWASPGNGAAYPGRPCPDPHSLIHHNVAGALAGRRSLWCLLLLPQPTAPLLLPPLPTTRERRDVLGPGPPSRCRRVQPLAMAVMLPRPRPVGARAMAVAGCATAP